MPSVHYEFGTDEVGGKSWTLQSLIGVPHLFEVSQV